MKKRLNKIIAICICIILCVVLLMQNIFVVSALSDDGSSTNENDVSSFSTQGETITKSYYEYFSEQSVQTMPNVEIPILTETMSLSEGADFSDKVTVETAGLYAIRLTYMVNDTEISTPSLSVKINGQIPYSEATTVMLPRRWKDKNAEDLYSTTETIPEQEEVKEYQTVFLKDNVLFYGGVLYFALKEGDNTVTISLEQGNVLISQMSFANPLEVQSINQKSFKYSDYKGEELIFEAEKSAFKSDASLYSVNDSSPDAIPSTPYAKLINTIGGTAWSVPGQYIEWQFDVPENALYQLNIKFKQNFVVGLSSHRRILIDGNPVYAETELVSFPYDSGYQNLILGNNGKPFKFELSKGKHTLRMEVVLGDFSEIISKTEDVVQALNDVSRQVVMIVGSNPDSLRDYQLEKRIPDTISQMGVQRKILEQIADDMEKKNGTASGATKTMRTMSKQLSEFVDDPYFIPSKINDFKSNLTALSTWLVEARKQSLQLDYFSLSAPGSDVKPASASFISILKHNILYFLYSFSGDYRSNVEDNNTGKENVTVWMGGGQAQFSIAKTLIKNDFKGNSNIDLKLTNTSVIIATAAGKGPDVVLGASEVMELAFRDAVVDLNKFSDIDEVKKRYRPSALTPITFDGHLYAIPATQTWSMLFYRKDVLDELGIAIPKTWSQVVTSLSTLQKHNMEFGITDVFSTLLFQRGGDYYNEERTALTLDNHTAISAFADSCSFFTDYGAPITFNAQNRFRTGEMPLVFSDINFYSTLVELAPEIRGLWGVTVMPGTEKADGSMDNTVLTTSTYSMMFKNDHEDACWEFFKWWTSDAIQSKYSQRIEMALGVSARYETANINSFNALSWPKEARDELNKQALSLKSIPAVPGDYFTNRHIGNAKNDVLYRGQLPADELMAAVEIINEELIYKRKALGLDRK